MTIVHVVTFESITTISTVNAKSAVVVCSIEACVLRNMQLINTRSSDDEQFPDHQDSITFRKQEWSGRSI